jgi:hypothetical protein
MQEGLEQRYAASLDASRVPPEQPSRGFLWLLTGLSALYCCWVFSLPVFPTQDGGIHLYYVNVIRHLLSGHSDFAAFYFLRHPLPPYAVHYALLLALTHFLTPVMAEKFVVCLILLLTAFGFRFLSRSVGGSGGAAMSLWVVPLALSWPLFMGFHNYCLSLSFSLWAWAIWLRAAGKRRSGFTIGFLLLVALIVFTHPVPLLLLLVVVTADLTVRIIQEKLRCNIAWQSALFRFRSDLAVAALAYTSLGYIALFLDKTSTALDLAKQPSRLDVASALVRLRGMTFATGGLGMQLYRGALDVILLAGFALAVSGFRRRWQKRNLDTRDVMLFCATAFALALPLLPPDLNGSEHFSDRLPIFVWMLVLAAAGATRILTARAQAAAAAVACLFAFLTLGLADHFIRPVANDLAKIENCPVTRHHIGLLFDAPVMIENNRLTFDPYLRWAGGRYFRRADAVMLNDPWVSPPFPLPLRRSENSLTASFSGRDFLDPATLHRFLINSPAERAALLSSIDFMLFVGKPKPGSSAPDPLLAADPSHPWNCSQGNWYFLCEPNQTVTAQNSATITLP